ncbi:unnamed protein product [Dicrocoelium dendriticum]|nr:unnamed protein product [Dicrocoelium dendriticum]
MEITAKLRLRKKFHLRKVPGNHSGASSRAYFIRDTRPQTRCSSRPAYLATRAVSSMCRQRVPDRARDRRAAAAPAELLKLAVRRSRPDGRATAPRERSETPRAPSTGPRPWTPELIKDSHQNDDFPSALHAIGRDAGTSDSLVPPPAGPAARFRCASFPQAAVPLLITRNSRRFSHSGIAPRATWPRPPALDSRATRAAPASGHALWSSTPAAPLPRTRPSQAGRAVSACSVSSGSRPGRLAAPPAAPEIAGPRDPVRSGFPEVAACTIRAYAAGLGGPPGS